MFQGKKKKKTVDVSGFTYGGKQESLLDKDRAIWLLPTAPRRREEMLVQEQARSLLPAVRRDWGGKRAR